MKIKNLIKLKSFSSVSLEKSTKNLLKLTSDLDNCKVSFFKNKTKKYKFTLLRSPHVHKKARDQFEQCTFKNTFIVETSIENAEKFLNELKNTLLHNVEYNIKLIKKV